MKFNADRLGKLAGFPVTSRRSLNEAGNRSQREDPGEPDDVDYRWGKNQLNEEEDFLTLDTPIQEEDGSEEGDESDTDPGEEDYTTKKGKKKKTSGQERGTKKGDEADVNETYGEDYLSQSRRGGSGEMADPSLDYTELEELGTMDWKGEGVEDEVDDEEKDEAPVEPLDEIMLELDENMLRREIVKMRRQRQSRLQESRLRSAIRNEIQGIFSELDLYKTDNKWVYGDKQPRNSRDGYVSRGFPGVGFR